MSRLTIFLIAIVFATTMITWGCRPHPPPKPPSGPVSKSKSLVEKFKKGREEIPESVEHVGGEAAEEGAEKGAEYMFDPNRNDQDGDGASDDVDNCFSTYNPNQENADKDQYGDACDIDRFTEMTVDTAEN